MEELPRVLRKREAYKTPEILVLLNETCAVEVKQTKSRTLPANSVKEHQYKALMQAYTGTLRYKIPDMGRRNPFDAIILKKIPAYIVVLFGDNTKIAIHIKDFPPITEKLTQDKALQIGRILE